MMPHQALKERYAVPYKLVLMAMNYVDNIVARPVSNIHRRYIKASGLKPCLTKSTSEGRVINEGALVQFFKTSLNWCVEALAGY